MMAKTARNAPCPCGSGRKYKHCCRLDEERLERRTRDEERVGRSISDWSVEQFGDELARAFEEFHPESRRIEERDFALLVTWFISDRELSAGGGTPIERYLARPDLDPSEREVAARIAAARLGLHRVRAVVPGRSVELEDVLTGASVVAASQSVSRAVVDWDHVLCRVMPGEPFPTLWGPVLLYAPDEEPELRAELERLADVFSLPRDAVGLGKVFTLAGRELLRFVPPSRLAEPSYFTGAQCIDPLLAREVLSGVDIVNKKPPACGRFFLLKEPSDGLEPSTPYHGGCGPQLCDAEKAVGSAHSLQFAWFLRVQHHLLEGP
jgi:hypothetical protein